jgi:hypothetical protein
MSLQVPALSRSLGRWRVQPLLLLLLVVVVVLLLLLQLLTLHRLRHRYRCSQHLQ